MLSRTALLLSVFLLPACQSTAPGSFSAADQAAIRAGDASFTKLAMAADWDHLVPAYYQADAVLLPPNEPAATGHAQIVKAFRAFPPIKTFTLHCDDIGGSGDLAYVCGTYQMTMVVDGATITDQGKSLCIYRRQADGSWKATRDAWNSDLPLPAAK